MIANHERGICESYVHESNHEFRDGSLAYEDGRTQRYVVKFGIWCVGIGFPTSDFARVIRFSSVNSICITEQMFAIDHRGGKGTLFISLIHGKHAMNVSTKSKEERLKEVRDYLASLQTLMKERYNELKRWRNHGERRSFVILLARDNRFRHDVFSYFKFHRDMEDWNIPSPYAALCDTNVDPGWWILTGYRCSEGVKVDMLMGQSGDVNPVLFTVNFEGKRSTPFEEKKRFKDLFRDRKSTFDLRLKDTQGTFTLFSTINREGYDERKQKRKTGAFIRQRIQT